MAPTTVKNGRSSGRRPLLRSRNGTINPNPMSRPGPRPAHNGGVYFTYWYSARKYQSDRIGSGVFVGSALRPLSAGKMMEITTSITRNSARGNNDMLMRLRRVCCAERNNHHTTNNDIPQVMEK